MCECEFECQHENLAKYDSPRGEAIALPLHSSIVVDKVITAPKEHLSWNPFLRLSSSYEKPLELGDASSTAGRWITFSDKTI